MNGQTWEICDCEDSIRKKSALAQDTEPRLRANSGREMRIAQKQQNG